MCSGFCYKKNLGLDPKPDSDWIRISQSIDLDQECWKHPPRTAFVFYPLCHHIQVPAGGPATFDALTTVTLSDFIRHSANSHRSSSLSAFIDFFLTVSS
jgi:hypothetical protein